MAQKSNKTKTNNKTTTNKAEKPAKASAEDVPSTEPSVEQPKKTSRVQLSW
jgi:hypothetical protein